MSEAIDSSRMSFFQGTDSDNKMKQHKKTQAVMTILFITCPYH